LHLPTHLAISWLVGAALPERRDRVAVAWIGALPDIDALSALGGRMAFAQWRHTIAHNLWFAALAAVAAGALARSRGPTAALAFAAIHVHFLCDLLGSGGDWGIPYLWPLSTWIFVSPLRWPLNSWQNPAITAAAFAAIGAAGVRRGRTVVEAFAPAVVDRAVVQTLQRRFGGAGKESTTP
jgi:membrane-bound metal-dependent hydrolase YbcI (DUF457 family)